MRKRFLFSVILLPFIVLTWNAPALAAEYIHSYRFSAPVIKDMGDGTVYPEMADCPPKLGPVGAPMLPRKMAKLFISAGETVESLKVVCAPALTLPGNYIVTPIPALVPLSKAHLAEAAAKDSTLYDSNAFYPGITHVDLGMQTLMGASLSVLQLCPVQYNPVDGNIAYYPKMTVTIVTRSTATPLGAVFRNRPSDRAAVLSAVDNKAAFYETACLAPANAEAAGPRQYLIITTENLREAMQNLADHRASTEGGNFNTHIALIEDIDQTISGRDLAEKMRNYIRDSYEHYGTEYVVLGGDAHGAPEEQTLPTRGCTAMVAGTLDTNIPSDLYFGCLDGSWDGNNNGLWGEIDDGTDGGDIDWHSEVYVGRINSKTPERALSQINKIIAYETSDKPFRSLMVGEIMDDEPTYGGDKMDWLAEFMPETPKTTLYDRDQSNLDWPANQLTDLLSSDEFVWINHLGHSYVQYNMKLTEDDIPDINNSKYFFVYTQGCYPGAMDNRDAQGLYGYEDSIVENMVSAEGRGPFAAVANSRYGWYMPGKVFDSASNLVHAYFIEQVVQGVRSLGKANQIPKANLDLTEQAYRWIAFESNLFGDPATQLPPQQRPDPPELLLSVEGTLVTLSWSTVETADGYTLFYAPAPFSGPDTIGSIDMGSQTEISFDLWSGAAFLAAVQARNGMGVGDYSNIESLVIP